MVGGIDKYYQVARCFRDEDLRADRQPEFTQVDMEMSFVEQEDMLQSIWKSCSSHMFQELMGREFSGPVPPPHLARRPWTRYGSDKPDLRFGLPIVDVTETGEGVRLLRVSERGVRQGGVVRAINVRGHADFTRTQIEELDRQSPCTMGPRAWPGLPSAQTGRSTRSLTKYFTQEQMDALLSEMDGAAPGDFILFCADKLATVRRTLGGLRLDLAEMLNLRREGGLSLPVCHGLPPI